MAYNPGVQDRSGEILAQGISQGFSSLTQGVERYYKKKEEKEILDSAVTSLMSQAASNPRLAPFIGGANMTDRKAVTNAVKGMGGGDVRTAVTALGQSMRQFNIYNQQQQDKEDDQAAFKLGMAARANNEDPLKVLAGSGQKINAGIASLFSDLASADAVAARNLAEAARVPVQRDPIPLNQQAFIDLTAAEERKLGRPLTSEERGTLALKIQTPPKAGFKDGDQKTINIGGKKISVIFSNNEWLSEDSLLPISVTSRDAIGNSVTGTPNPAIFGATPFSFPGSTPTPTTPSEDSEIPTLTPEQAKNIKPGTRFKTNDGRVLVR